MRPDVVLGYCHDGRSVDSMFHDCVVATLRSPFGRRLADVVSVGAGPRIAVARNEVVRAFLSHPENPTWLWMVDTDMTWAPEAPGRLLEVASEERPVVGGLCFAAGRGPVVTPTLYVLHERVREGGGATVGVIEDWPPDSLVRVTATGAAFLVVHRRVLEAMAEHVGGPQPWFAEGVDRESGAEYSEDWTFCVRAGRLGFPVHVHTGVEIGHRKPYVFTSRDHALYRERRAAFGSIEALAAAEADRVLGRAVVTPFEMPADVEAGPTYVVVAHRDRPHCVDKLVTTLLGEEHAPDAVYVFDNGSVDVWTPPPDERVHVFRRPEATIHEMWNQGLHMAQADAARRGCARWQVLVVNDDVVPGPGMLGKLVAGLRADERIAIAYPGDGTGSRVVPTAGLGPRGMPGWCLMIAGETGLRYDCRYTWWYGDNDIELTARVKLGKLVCRVEAASAEHLHPNESTLANPGLQAAAARDRETFMAKWGIGGMR